MRCKVCNAYIPEGAIHCLECGEEIEECIICQKCGTQLSSQAAFCTKCGAPVSRPASPRRPDDPAPLPGKPPQPGIHTCFRCGNKVPDGVKYCPVCGTSHDWIDNPAPKPVEPEYISPDPDPQVTKPEGGTCPRCGTELRGNARFCYNCGRFQKSDIVDVICPACGAANILRYARCQYCGADLPPPAIEKK